MRGDTEAEDRLKPPNFSKTSDGRLRCEESKNSPQIRVQESCIAKKAGMREKSRADRSNGK